MPPSPLDVDRDDDPPADPPQTGEAGAGPETGAAGGGGCGHEDRRRGLRAVAGRIGRAVRAAHSASVPF